MQAPDNQRAAEVGTELGIDDIYTPLNEQGHPQLTPRSVASNGSAETLFR